MKPRYAVAAVSINDCKVIWVSEPHDADNADAVIKVAIMRQGVEDRFFAPCQISQYKAGDRWEGGVELSTKASDSDSTIEVIGGMAFPKGPRGL